MIFGKKDKKNAKDIVQKGKTPKKESRTREAAYVSSGEDYVQPIDIDLNANEIQRLYKNSSLLKRYIKIMIDEITRYDIIAKPVEGKEANALAIKRAKEVNNLFSMCNPLETFREVREKYLKDLLLYGAGAIELEPSTKSETVAMYAACGYTIRLNVDKTGVNVRSKKETYQIMDPDNPSGDPIASLPFNALVYLTYDGISDKVYGLIPITSIYQELLTDMQAAKNLQQGVNTMKAGIIFLKKAPRRLVVDLMKKINMMLKKNARVRVACTNYEGKFEDMSNSTPESTIDMQKWIMTKANIFNIPTTKLGLTSEGAMGSREQKEDFRANIENFVRYEIAKLNAVLINAKLGYGDHIKLTCPSFATKVDYERARIAVRLVNGKIITPNEARQEYLGLDKVDKDEQADQIQYGNEESQETPPKEKN